MRQQLVTLLDRVQVRAAETAERTARNRHAVDAVLSWALERAEAEGPLYFPVEYVQFLRDCTERSWAIWRELRNDAGEPDHASRRSSSPARNVSHARPTSSGRTSTPRRDSASTAINSAVSRGPPASA